MCPLVTDVTDVTEVVGWFRGVGAQVCDLVYEALGVPCSTIELRDKGRYGCVACILCCGVAADCGNETPPERGWLRALPRALSSDALCCLSPALSGWGGLGEWDCYTLPSVATA